MPYVFGPVPSRRLGLSLGVDLVPFKTCTYDCIYCQLGCTTRLTTERREWAPVEPLLAELKEKLEPRPDYITFSGSGEPTLHSRLGEIIERIKAMTDVPVAVLTNGSLLWQPEARASLRRADLVSPSLDAGDAAAFEAVNRPPAGFSFERMVAGLEAFRGEFSGQYWLEVFVLAGYTGTVEAMRRIAACAARIRPDRVQLNTVSRPPAEGFARGVSREQLLEFAPLFTPPAEIIAEFPHAARAPGAPAGIDDVLDLIRRHPATARDVAEGLGLAQAHADGYIGGLLAAGRIVAAPVGAVVYYRASTSSSR